ncbi:hypothetical protein NLJ89_g6500 [Agrocybe chaxingu]|uniref:Uncharacterized protein n=1 Tax=Agrocybe chaxingu TaxID=84603 RepID=A0A9W8MVY3_9AGAR|nr:hypothetical protein NLJ89_g6500 [Agrocybe chaxingu]
MSQSHPAAGKVQQNAYKMLLDAANITNENAKIEKAKLASENIEAERGLVILKVDKGTEVAKAQMEVAKVQTEAARIQLEVKRARLSKGAEKLAQPWAAPFASNSLIHELWMSTPGMAPMMR